MLTYAPTYLQAQLLAAERLDLDLRPEPEAPEVPSQLPTEETILRVPLTPSRRGTPATPSSLRRTTSSLAESFSRRSSRRGTAEDAPGSRRASYFDGLGAAIGDGLGAANGDAVGTVGPNEAPCTTPEEERYPDWWDEGPKKPDNYEFVPVRHCPSSIRPSMCFVQVSDRLCRCCNLSDTIERHAAVVPIKIRVRPEIRNVLRAAGVKVLKEYVFCSQPLCPQETSNRR